MESLITWISIIISGISLIISIFVWRVQRSNQKIQQNLYYLTQDERFNSNTIMKLVYAEQINENISTKLVVFNVDVKPIFIHSLSVYKIVKSKNFIRKFFNIEDKEYIRGMEWWPKYKEGEIKQKCIHEEYSSLLVNEIIDLQLIFPGEVDWDTRYEFVLTTNKAKVSIVTSVKAGQSYFPYMYSEDRKYST